MLLEGEMARDFPGETTSREPFTLSSIRKKKALLYFYPSVLLPQGRHPRVHA